MDANSGGIVVGWLDKKKTSLISNYLCAEPEGTRKRWVKEQNAKIDVPCPHFEKRIQ